MINSFARAARRALAVAAGLALVAGPIAIAAAPAALAAKGGTCTGFTLTTGGNSYKGSKDFTIPASKIGSTIVVKGKYVEFTVRPTDFAVSNYTLTGADSPRPAKNLPLDAPTVVFASKMPQIGAVLTGGIDVRLDRAGDMRMERSGGGQDMKIQAKNCSMGGLFQMEAEPGTTFTHQLGADFSYNGPAGTGRLCFTNGDFASYESPELATRTAPADGLGTTSTWQVSSGGRMGYVVGEDAVEGGCAA
jgi:hypothetical protein